MDAWPRQRQGETNPRRGATGGRGKIGNRQADDKVFEIGLGLASPGQVTSAGLGSKIRKL